MDKKPWNCSEKTETIYNTMTTGETAATDKDHVTWSCDKIVFSSKDKLKIRKSSKFSHFDHNLEAGTSETSLSSSWFVICCFYVTPHYITMSYCTSMAIKITHEAFSVELEFFQSFPKLASFNASGYDTLHCSDALWKSPKLCVWTWVSAVGFKTE